MKILLLAPHPFYQERGTPIAVDLLLRALSRRGDEVDVLTYHEGEDRKHKGVTIQRISAPSVKGIRPGFSFKKLICDWHLWTKAKQMVKNNKYDLIHAVEESAFIAMNIKKKTGIPYIFDMDSSMPEQIVEKKPFFMFLLPYLRNRETKAIHCADAVVVMCDSLAEMAKRCGGQNVTVLTDISLLDVFTSDNTDRSDSFPDMDSAGTTFMYIGNLETYQGVDLMLDSFAIAQEKDPEITLIIVGGLESDIARYKTKASNMGLAERVHFLGPRPIGMMKYLFSKADVLVSPRSKGRNTPMKIYSYLDSGKPVLATDLPTHTQVLTNEVACLAQPNTTDFAKAMSNLTNDESLRKRLADNASKLVREKYSFDVFETKVHGLYKKLEEEASGQ